MHDARFRLLPAALLPLVALAFAGCTNAPGVGTIDPNEGSDYVSGRTIHLNMKVVDFDQELYPGLHTYLWAFCATPFDATDAISAAAIQPFTPLPGDGTNLSEADRGSCSVPGPTIRVQQGDRVIVEFANSHFHPHTIHWHGQYVPNEMDGAQGATQKAVLPSESFTYDFIAKRAGTLWYHCHVDAGFHVMQGLYGMFIVEPHDKSHEPSDVDHEQVMVLSTMRRVDVEAVPGVGRHNHPAGCFVSGTPNCQNPPVDLTPDVYLINGHSYPYTMQQAQSVVHLAEGKTVRLRLLNAGNTIEEVHLHGQDMKVVAQDGVPLAVPYYVDTLRIGPAERFDVTIHGDNPGVWLLHTHVADHETNDGQFPGGMHAMLVYDGWEDKMEQYPMELPGGLPYMTPVSMPADFHGGKDLALGTGASSAPIPQAQPAAGTWTFPYELPCSVQRLEVTVFLGGGAAARASQLNAEVLDANGAKLAEFPLGLTPGGGTASSASYATNFTATPSTQLLPAGNMTVRVSGVALDADVRMDAHVIHFASFDTMRELKHRVPSMALCGAYGNGNNGRDLGPPPI